VADSLAELDRIDSFPQIGTIVSALSAAFYAKRDKAPISSREH
jgi:hypothetical protein